MIRTLQARNKELEHFTFVSHHDLQEPLRKIAVFSELIKEQDYEKLSLPSQNKLDKINAAAHNISAALKDVLAYATITGEEPHQSVDLNKVFANALTDLEPLVREKKATVHTVQLPTLSAIPEQMQQVFYNLLSNALKFSKPYEQEPPVIKVTCALFDPAAEPDLDPSKRYHKIAITDNGIGFSPEFSEKIFLMFQRLNNREMYNGTGIGLAVCRKIVENHNGKIRAVSQPGKGSTFVLLLPE
jgi:light-regulated signal transduction histidine kinase (bacteriophytochrome)